MSIKKKKKTLLLFISESTALVFTATQAKTLTQQTWFLQFGYVFCAHRISEDHFVALQRARLLYQTQPVPLFRIPLFFSFWLKTVFFRYFCMKPECVFQRPDTVRRIHQVSPNVPFFGGGINVYICLDFHFHWDWVSGFTQVLKLQFLVRAQSQSQRKGSEIYKETRQLRCAHLKWL